MCLSIPQVSEWQDLAGLCMSYLTKDLQSERCTNIQVSDALWFSTPLLIREHPAVMNGHLNSKFQRPPYSRSTPSYISSDDGLKKVVMLCTCLSLPDPPKSPPGPSAATWSGVQSFPSWCGLSSAKSAYNILKTVQTSLGYYLNRAITADFVIFTEYCPDSNL